METTETYRSVLSGEYIAPELAAPIRALRPGLFRFLQKRHPSIDPNGFLSAEELRHLEKEYLDRVLLKKNDSRNRLNQKTLETIADDDLISLSLEAGGAKAYHWRDRLSDHVADFFGSWTFILFFLFTLIFWIVLNTFWLTGARSFDPFPFILLNLVLSCIAAIQAPLIMMSQNRMEAKDRARAINDYQINLKAEIEIRQLHQKVDLLTHQQQRWLREWAKFNKNQPSPTHTRAEESQPNGQP